MARYEQIQAVNPQLTIYDSRSEVFKRYGNFIGNDTKEICEIAIQNLVIPEKGSCYIPAMEALDQSSWAEELRKKNCGCLDEQIGVCYGHSDQMNALEWHTCAEFNVAVTDMILILAKREDIEGNNRINADKVKFFYIHQGDLIEVYSDTLHFCPCEVSKEGFISIVGLQRGTNLPLQDESMRGLLRAQNKWLIAHEGNEAMIETGAVAGIYGENWKIKSID